VTLHQFEDGETPATVVGMWMHRGQKADGLDTMLDNIGR